MCASRIFNKRKHILAKALLPKAALLDWFAPGLRHIEMKQNKNEYFGQITVAFLSSRIQETEAKLLVPLRRGCNVEVNGCWDQGCWDWRTSWYAVSNWRRIWSGVESGSLCMTLTDQHCCLSTGRDGVLFSSSIYVHIISWKSIQLEFCYLPRKWVRGGA